MVSAVRRVAKNAAIPMAASLVNKALDFAFAIVMLRALGPTEIGRYTWAVLVVGYFDLVINFGLGVLITRDVAREPRSADRYLGGAAIARTGLWLLCVAGALGVAGPLSGHLDLTPEMGITLAVLTVGIGVSNLSGLAAALFSARELMEYPAMVAVFTTVTKLVLGVAALALGYGIIGIAMVSVAANLLTSVVFLALLLRVVGRPSLSFDAGFSVALLRTSYPLMVNNLLATIFFRIDGLILRSLWGDSVLGWYGTAYKFIDGLNVIPSSLTLALFPVLARLGQSEPKDHNRAVGPQGSDLARATGLALKMLLTLALPISVGTTLLADPIVRTFAGAAFLPHAAIALQVLIWFLPFSFANGLLQYVLIAADQQRFITACFAVSVAFNLTANLLLIPGWSYVGASSVTILSELVLLGLFSAAVQRHVGSVRLVTLMWRPAAASMAMAPLVWALGGIAPILAVLGGAALYGAVFVALGGVTREERQILRRVVLPTAWIPTPPAEVRPASPETAFR